MSSWPVSCGNSASGSSPKSLVGTTQCQKDTLVIERQKKLLTTEDLDTQTALELPDRKMLALVNVNIVDVLNNLTISIPVQNNKVAVQVCAAVLALNSITTSDQFTCTVGQ